MTFLKITVFLCVVSLHACSGSVIDYLFGAAPENTGRPAFCKSHQCPNFTVITTGQDYELRRYQPTTWAATAKEEGWFSRFSMFRRLAKYTLRGYNDLGVRMPMTVPVLTKVTTSRPDVMYFMLPEDRQSNPPTPRDPLVFLVSMHAFSVYVRSFGGYASNSDYTNEVLALKQSLAGTGARYNHDVMYRVGYDSPFTMFNRHNEVWLVAE